ncbi:hypothetical protein EIM11_32110, partial [Pseudomonas aeruginosa]
MAGFGQARGAGQAEGAGADYQYVDVVHASLAARCSSATIAARACNPLARHQAIAFADCVEHGLIMAKSEL